MQRVRTGHGSRLEPLDLLQKLSSSRVRIAGGKINGLIEGELLEGSLVDGVIDQQKLWNAGLDG